jgi:ornithine cyclodeaminase
MRVLALEDIKQLISRVGIGPFFLQLIARMEKDYARWNDFEKSPRHAIYFPKGVIELMPIADRNDYSVKYVNGHSQNPKEGKLTVVGLGLCAHVENGYPYLLTEMTLLTGIRTAAASALASRYLSRKKVKRFGIIGTGAQSEFQTLAHSSALGIEEVYYYDIAEHAMQKFAHNLRSFGLTLKPCHSGREVVEQSDIVTIAVAAPGHQKIVHKEWVRPGTHLNGIGGDSHGKTELDPELTAVCKIVVQFLEQTKEEGEIQLLKEPRVYAELWELAANKKPGRTSDKEITLFDSVGFALEDFSVLALVHVLAEQYRIGQQINLIPETLQDPKNLFSLLEL